ncbi:MAG: ankyrin repeat domain-containing protein [Candidatus Thiodiazotropha sp. (ex Dulcina madagascariensis)]|nr:ankyrin repeat domain-containing protein [Candidatus Thiodiazotropha sp. (ex Dulcina madagascariensis)]
MSIGTRNIYRALIVLTFSVLLAACSASEPPRPTVSLHDAVNIGDLEQLERHIYWGSDVNAENDKHLTAIMLAFAEKKFDVMDLLLENGADINKTSAFPRGSRGKERRTSHIFRGAPIHYAAFVGDLEGVDYLLKQKARVNEFNFNNELCEKKGCYTPLHISILNKDKEMIQKLAAAGSDINKANIEKGGRRSSPLASALASAQPDIAKLIIELGGNPNLPNENGLTPLHIASVIGYIDIVKLLVEKGVDINAVYTEKHFGIVDHSTPIDKVYETEPNKNTPEIVDYLISNGALAGVIKKVEFPKTKPPRSKGYLKSKLIKAVQNNKTSVVRRLIKRGADVESVGLCALSVITSIDIWGQFIEAGARNINCKNEHNYAPLHQLSLWVEPRPEVLKVIRILIALGADVNEEGFTVFKQTPLYNAAMRGNLRIAHILLSNGADVNVKDRNNYTPLDIAVEHKHEKVIKLLKLHGGESGSQ